MNWLTLANLIIQVGLPAAEKIWQKWQSNSEPTQADWDELKALGQQTPESIMIAALARNNVPIDSPKAIELLALVKGNQ